MQPMNFDFNENQIIKSINSFLKYMETLLNGSHSCAKRIFVNDPLEINIEKEETSNLENYSIITSEKSSNETQNIQANEILKWMMDRLVEGLNVLKHLLNQISDKFSDELNTLIDIEYITNYILQKQNKNQIFSKKEIDLLLDINLNFLEIVLNKMEFISNDKTEKEYLKKFKQLEIDFFEFQEKYYLEVFDEDFSKYEDAAIKLSNTLRI
ncbi:hypothetical protein [Methanobrevibacter sp. DSM 116169]|uniref:hypothetical protein n=1 Tax=Methanobrevibacter sp. DSM 116169 TaxID=3242727 RepID=UPI0038FC5B4D